MNKNAGTGVSYGVVIGLIYALLLFWRYTSATSLIQFSLYTLLSFVVILVLMVVEALNRRKAEGGYIDLKNLFQTLFISVLIFQFICSLYIYIHLTYVDPNVADRMMQGMRDMFDKLGDKISDKDRDEAMKKMEEIKKVTELPVMIKNYLTSVATSGVFALIISAIVKKNKPVFGEVNQ